MLYYAIAYFFGKYYMYKIFAVLVLLIFSAGANAATVKKVKQPPPPPTYVLWNVDTEEYVTDHNGSMVRPIASLTKLMTVYVVWNEGLDMDEELTVFGREASTKIRRGMKLSRGALVELTLVSSDNLAARTLAESHPGGYLKFIDEMNKAAGQLEMWDTKFQDATGLLGGNVSSASDIRKLVLAVADIGVINKAANATAVEFTSKVVHKNRTKEILVVGNNTNYFAGKLDIVAAKTGYTSSAGRCLTMLFNYRGSTYLLVVMGAQSSQHRKKMVEHLLDNIK